MRTLNGKQKVHERLMTANTHRGYAIPPNVSEMARQFLRDSLDRQTNTPADKWKGK